MKFIILSVVYCRTNSKLFRTWAFHRWRWNRAEFSSINFFTDGQKNNYPFKTHLLTGQGTDCTSWAQSVFPKMGFGWAECYNPKWDPVRQSSWNQPGECTIWLEPSLAPVGFSTRGVISFIFISIIFIFFAIHDYPYLSEL